MKGYEIWIAKGTGPNLAEKSQLTPIWFILPTGLVGSHLITDFFKYLFVLHNKQL